jgi:hypothetical protein
MIDRAAFVATAVIQIITASSVSEQERQVHVENLLRDEFEEARREAVADRRLDVDA